MVAAAHPLKLLASISRLHIVAIAALGTFTFGWLFTGVYPWLLSAVCALDWFLVNLLNRIVDLREDQANAIVGTDFVARHRQLILVLGLTLLIVSLAATLLLAPAILPLRLAYHALGFAYNWALVPGWRRIKQRYFWKNTASASGFILTVFGYPLVAAAGWRLDSAGLAPDVTITTILLSAGFFFLFELSYEVIYDLRDAEGDALAEVRTYPVVHGQQVAIRIIDGLLVSSLLFLAVGYALGQLPWRIFIMFCAPLMQFVLYKRALRRGLSAQDCVNLTWLGAGLLFSYHLWVAAGLPGTGISS